jgi:hypothetical protein
MNGDVAGLDVDVQGLEWCTAICIVVAQLEPLSAVGAKISQKLSRPSDVRGQILHVEGVKPRDANCADGRQRVLAQELKRLDLQHLNGFRFGQRIPPRLGFTYCSRMAPELCSEQPDSCSENRQMSCV